MDPNTELTLIRLAEKYFSSGDDLDEANDALSKAQKILGQNTNSRQYFRKLAKEKKLNAQLINKILLEKRERMLSQYPMFKVCKETEFKFDKQKLTEYEYVLNLLQTPFKLDFDRWLIMTYLYQNKLDDKDEDHDSSLAHSIFISTIIDKINQRLESEILSVNITNSCDLSNFMVSIRQVFEHFIPLKEIHGIPEHPDMMIAREKSKEIITIMNSALTQVETIANIKFKFDLTAWNSGVRIKFGHAKQRLGRIKVIRTSNNRFENTKMYINGPTEKSTAEYDQFFREYESIAELYSDIASYNKKRDFFLSITDNTLYISSGYRSILYSIGSIEFI